MTAHKMIDVRDRYLVVNTETRAQIQTHATLMAAQRAAGALNSSELRAGRKGVYDVFFHANCEQFRDLAYSAKLKGIDISRLFAEPISHA